MVRLLDVTSTNISGNAMIAHLLSSSALLSGSVLALLLAWLIGSAVLTLRAGKTAAGPSHEEEQQEAIRRSRRLEPAAHLKAGSEPVQLAVVEAPASARTGQVAALKHGDSEPADSLSASADAL
jgi:hypothetical protein